jgi:hypothetical protein
MRMTLWPPNQALQPMGRAVLVLVTSSSLVARPAAELGR